MRPNDEADETLVPGLLKFTVLNRLKNSARNWMFISVVKTEVLKEPEIDRLAGRAEVLAAQGLAERAVRVDGECRGIEPDRLGQIPRGGSNGAPV